MLLRRYFDVLDEIVDHIAEIGACLHVLFDLLHGVDGGGVISAEVLYCMAISAVALPSGDTQAKCITSG